MSAGRPVPVFTELNSVDELKALLVASESKLILIDIHEEWCGQTTAVQPFLNQLWIEIDEPDKKIQLTNVRSNIPGVQKLAQQWAGNEVKVAQQGCKPLFILLRHGQAVATIDGALPPLLRMYIDLHVPKKVA